MSVAANAPKTAHIARADNNGGDEADVAEAAARAFGKCLKQCVALDPRRAGAVVAPRGRRLRVTRRWPGTAYAFRP